MAQLTQAAAYGSQFSGGGDNAFRSYIVDRGNDAAPYVRMYGEVSDEWGYQAGLLDSIKPIDDWHLRALQLQQEYAIVALFKGKVGWEHRVLDENAMRTASTPLVGRLDFSSFRAAGCQAKSPVRDLQQISIGRFANWIWFDMVANAFLQHMVRNIVGTLIEVGAGERPVEWLADVLAACDRKLAGPTAPPDGLYLTSIRYPERFQIPHGAAEIKYW